MAGKIGVLTSRRYQMQTKFASPTDRAPVESWVQPTNQPPHRNFAAKVAGFAAAIVAGAFFFGVPPLTEEPAQGGGSSPQLLVFKVRNQQAANQQALFWSTFTPQAESITADKFVQPTNQPYPYKRSLATSNQPYFFYDPSFDPESVSADKFVQPISQPYPYKKVQSTAEQQASFWNTSTAAEDVSADKFVQPISQPYPYKKYELTTNQPYFFYDPSFDPESVSADKFVQPTNQPYPYKKYELTANQPYFFSYIGPSLTEEPPQGLGAFPPLLAFKSPRYSKAAIEPNYFYNPSFDPEVVSADRFVQPTNQPYPYKRVQSTAEQQALFWNPTTPLKEEPPQGEGSKQELLLFKDSRLSRAALEPSVSWSTFTPPIVQPLSFDWLREIEQPLKRVKTNNDYAYLFYDPSVDPESVSADKFVQPVSQPYPYKKSLLTANQQATFWNTSTDSESVSADKFVQPISQPYLYKKAQSTAEQQAAFWNTSTQAEVVTVDKFGQPTNQPYPYKKYELVSNQPYFFYGAETVSVDKFTVQYPDQHLQKKYLSAAQQQSFTWAVPQAPEVVSADRFVQPVSQPYPYKRSLSASNQPYFFWSTFTPGAAPAVVTGWTPYYPDLVNPKRYLLTSEQQATFWNTSTSPENVSVDKFGQPISQPYPYKKILGTANQQAVFSDGLESIVVDKFAQQTNQPYPYKKSLFVGHVPFFTYIGPPLKEEPPQGEGSKPTLLSFKVRNYIAANQQTSVFQEIDSSDWIPETEQPQNKKRRVDPEAYSWSTFTPVVSTFFNVSWIQPTEQPFPSKKLLITALQQSTFGPPSATSITFTNLPLLGTGEVLTDFGSGGFTSNVSGVGTVLQSSTGIGLTTVPAIGSGIVIFPAIPVPPIPVTDNGTEASWHQMISQPTPGRKYLVANQEASFWNTSNQPETVTADKFVQPISQPLNKKKSTSNQVSFFMCQAELVTADKFVQPISQPVNKKKGALASNQVSFFMCHPLFG